MKRKKMEDKHIRQITHHHRDKTVPHGVRKEEMRISVDDEDSLTQIDSIMRKVPVCPKMNIDMQ